MRLINHTQYDSRALKKVMSAVHEYIATKEGRLHSWSTGCTVEVKYARNLNCYNGHAWVDGYKAILRLSRPVEDGHNQMYLGNFIWLWYHELMHLYGYTHRQFYDIHGPEILKVIRQYLINHTSPTEKLPHTDLGGN